MSVHSRGSFCKFSCVLVDFEHLTFPRKKSQCNFRLTWIVSNKSNYCAVSVGNSKELLVYQQS